MKVALMTIFQVPNYGSVSQAFATQTILEKLGYDCDVINYAYPNEWHFRKGLARPGRLKGFIKKILSTLHIYDDRFNSVIARFRETRLNLTRNYRNLEALNEEDWSSYHALISGSDQVWNPRFHHADIAFMLSFGSDEIKRIAISSSFACPSLPSDMISKYRKWIGRFGFISVREEDGLTIIQDQLQLNLPSHVILDPTLLLSGKEWSSVLALPERKKERYVLLYILDYAFNPRPHILRIAEDMKKRFACEKILTFSKNDSLEVRELGAESIEGCSVEDFVSYFKNAEVVVTSSFHGTAFALNFSRPLISVCPTDGDSRQRSLLKLLGLSDKAVSEYAPNANLDADYDASHVQSALDALRAEHIQLIKTALEV